MNDPLPDTLCPPPDASVDDEHKALCKAVGALMARRVFCARGNHSEAHIGEEELATWLGAVYSLGKKGLVPVKDGKE
jgi:hypothetical protein